MTDIPGTTRDTLTEAVQIGGVRVLLTDTAGLRETGDAVERIGVERAKKALAEADVRALVLDSASPLTEEDKAALFGLAPQMIVLSKGDLAQRLTAADVRAAQMLAVGRQAVIVDGGEDIARPRFVLDRQAVDVGQAGELLLVAAGWLDGMVTLAPCVHKGKLLSAK